MYYTNNAENSYKLTPYEPEKSYQGKITSPASDTVNANNANNTHRH